MGGRDHSCETCGHGGFGDPGGRCICPPSHCDHVPPEYECDLPQCASDEKPELEQSEVWTCPVCHRNRAMKAQVRRGSGAYPIEQCDECAKPPETGPSVAAVLVPLTVAEAERVAERFAPLAEQSGPDQGIYDKVNHAISAGQPETGQRTDNRKMPDSVPIPDEAVVEVALHGYTVNLPAKAVDSAARKIAVGAGIEVEPGEPVPHWVWESARFAVAAALPHLEPAIRADEREKAAERIEAKRRPMVFREHPHRAWYEGQNRAIDAALAALKGEHEDS